MTSNTKLKIKAATAEEICTAAPISESGRPLLRPQMTPLAFFDALGAAGLFADAVQFMARALPKREAVWWACLCARETVGTAARPEHAAGLRAAEAWVYRPNEEHRRQAEAAGNAIASSHPTKWAAMAAFWSGGSMGPPDAPETKPPDDFTAKAVAGSILMAAGVDPALAPQRQRIFFESGLDIANGGTGRPLART